MRLHTAVYSKDAELITEITAERKNNTVTVRYTKSDKRFTVKLSGSDKSAVCEPNTDEVVIEL